MANRAAIGGLELDLSGIRALGARRVATHFRPRDIYIATLVGALNQIDCGTTTLVDWCHNNATPAHTDAAVAALRAAGIRAMFMHGTPKPDPKPGEPPYWEVPHRARRSCGCARSWRRTRT